MQRICVYCGSSHGAQAIYRDVAAQLGTLLAVRGIGLVYGGGRVGLMGVVADAVLAGGGEAIGIIPHHLATKELAHDGLTDLRVVSTMHERKALMAELSDGFVTLPGGYGTAEEFFETLTWAQLGIHSKPLGLLNIAGFYDPLLLQVERYISEGFVRASYRDLIIDDTDPQNLLDRLAAYQPPAVVKWMESSET